MALSFVAAPASFAETIKSAEPISSLTLATLTRGEDSVSTAEWLTTLPIVVGVALSSYGDSSFHIFGFFAASLSNFLFSMRGLNTKQLRRLHGTPHGLDDMHLFYRISRFGAALVIPIALVLEGPKLLRFLFRNGEGHATAGRSVPRPLVIGDAATESSLGGAGSSAATGVAQRAPGAANAHGGEGVDEAGRTGSLASGGLVAMSLLNGVCYFTYNQTSFVVLGRVSFVTHATLNVMRRVCIIIVTAVYFATPITPTNALGICLAISGFSIFLYANVTGSSLSLPR